MTPAQPLMLRAIELECQARLYIIGEYIIRLSVNSRGVNEIVSNLLNAFSFCAMHNVLLPPWIAKFFLPGHLHELPENRPDGNVLLQAKSLYFCRRIGA